MATYTRSGGCPLSVGLRIWHLAVEMFKAQEYEVDLSADLTLAVNHNISTYDAQLIQLAQGLETRLITEDKRLLKNFTGLAAPLA